MGAAAAAHCLHTISAGNDAGRTTQFIADVIFSAAHADRAFDDTGCRLAATALLIHVVSLDGQPSRIEKRKLHCLIESRFGLDPGTADQLIASATGWSKGRPSSLSFHQRHHALGE